MIWLSFVFIGLSLGQKNTTSAALDWQQRFCRHVCDRTLECRRSTKGSYCKIDQDPQVCFGLYHLPRREASLVEKIKSPLMFCSGNPGDSHRCIDSRVKPVGCSRRPTWNKQGRVVDLDTFVNDETWIALKLKVSSLIVFSIRYLYWIHHSSYFKL